MRIDKYSISLNEYLYGKQFREEMKKRKVRAYYKKLAMDILGAFVVTALLIVCMYLYLLVM